MKTIPLTQGKFALVDDEDYEFLMQWKWSFLNTRTGYAIRGDYSEPKRKMVYMHRLVMKTPPHLQVDHINKNSLDNQKKNLRNCNQNENRQNMRKYNGAFSSNFRGVKKVNSNWVAQIQFNKKLFHIGTFKEEHHAALARDLWALDLHGDFAQTNFPTI